MKNKNMQKGITLVALIVTILILLILCGISINAIMGNTGLFNKARIAENKTRQEEATEKINLKITTAQIGSYIENKRTLTLKELAQKLQKDSEILYVEPVAQPKIGATDWTKIQQEPTSVYTRLKDYTYEFEIDKNLQLASIDGVKIASGNNGIQMDNCTLNISPNSIVSVSGIEGLSSFVVVRGNEFIGVSKNNEFKLGAYEDAADYYAFAIDNKGKFYKSNVVNYEQLKEYLYNCGTENNTFNLWYNYECYASKEMGNYIYLSAYDPYTSSTAGVYTYSSSFDVGNYNYLVVKLKDIYSNTEYFPFRTQICDLNYNVLKEDIFYGTFDGNEEKEIVIDLADFKNKDATFRFLMNTAPHSYCDVGAWGIANGYTGSANCKIEKVMLVK